MDSPDERAPEADREEIDDATRDAERAESSMTAHADRMPTPDEEKLADGQTLDPKVAEHEREMLERGAHQEGEGRVP